MKTSNKTNKSFPTPFRFSAYILAVAVFCFINWTFLKASDPVDLGYNNIENMVDPLVADFVEHEPEMELETWMMSVAGDYLAETSENEIVLEDWMLNFADDYLAANAEHDIALEDWMIDYDVFCSIDSDEEQILKEWMVNTNEWSRNELLAKK